MLKNCIDMHYSLHHYNPQPNIPGDSLARCERSIIGGTPQKQLVIHSNPKNIPLVPFIVDFLYLTIDCKDSELLEDVCLTVKATIQESTKRKKGDEDTYEDRLPRNIKNNLISFK